VETARLKLAPDHLYTIESILRLSAANLALGKTDEALPLASEAYDLAKTKLGVDHLWTLEILQNLADVQQGKGNLDEAQRCCQEVLELRKAKLGQQHPDTLSTMASLGFNLASQRKHAEAEPLLLTAYEGLKAREDKRLTNGKPWIDMTLQGLVELYTAWDKPEEAAKWRALLPASATKKKTGMNATKIGCKSLAVQCFAEDGAGLLH
jgi:tetratricopeptide (TPR) repeat protein